MGHDSDFDPSSPPPSVRAPSRSFGAACLTLCLRRGLIPVGVAGVASPHGGVNGRPAFVSTWAGRWAGVTTRAGARRGTRRLCWGEQSAVAGGAGKRTELWPGRGRISEAVRNGWLSLGRKDESWRV